MPKRSTIEFSVKVVEDGEVRFDSSITCDPAMDAAAQQNAVEGWLEMMQAGLKMGRALSSTE